MGKLIEGTWSSEWYNTSKTSGRFVRKDSQFRDWVRADGSTAFTPDLDRYHLYVSYACPWAHRALIYRALKGLDDVISVTSVDPYMGSDGWRFSPTSGADPILGKDLLWEVYVAAESQYTGRVTVPILWDRSRGTIVNNESSEIIRMLNTEFNGYATNPTLDLYPEPLRDQIDRWNTRIYPDLNNGVYRAGFATTQSAYEEAVGLVFKTLDVLESHLSRQRYLCGHAITEADVRLFTTLFRFDAVYYGHFKCSLRRLTEYPHLWGYARDIFQHPGIADTCDLEQTKLHYYGSHPTINPTGVVPLGPNIDWLEPASRELL